MPGNGVGDLLAAGMDGQRSIVGNRREVGLSGGSAGRGLSDGRFQFRPLFGLRVTTLRRRSECLPPSPEAVPIRSHGRSDGGLEMWVSRFRHGYSGRWWGAWRAVSNIVWAEGLGSRGFEVSWRTWPGFTTFSGYTVTVLH